MTEAGMITSNPLRGERIAGTVGFPLPDVEARVVDGEGEELPAGEVGMLEIRGPNLFPGYWGLAEKTAEEMRGDGFFVTGDLASLDAEGRVTLVGRGKDLIIAGGFNVYPKEVEDRLDEVAGVRECAVIGAPHADLGEGVVAVLVAEAGDRGRRYAPRRARCGSGAIQAPAPLLLGRRAAAQRHGEGAEEGAARAVSRRLRRMKEEAQ